MPAYSQYGDGKAATMRDLGYYWKAVIDSKGNKHVKCFNVGNNQSTEKSRCIDAQRMAKERYRSGD